MGSTTRFRSVLRMLAALGLVGSSACAWVSGLDHLEEVSAPSSDDSGTDVAPDGSGSALDGASESTPVDSQTSDAPETTHDGQSDSSLLDASGEGSAPLHAVTRVQVVAPGWAGVSKLTLPLSETTGNLLVAGVYAVSSTPTFSVVDSLGNSWKHGSPQTNLSAGCQGGAGTVAQIYYAESIKGGLNVVTVQQAGTVGLGAFVIEYAGLLDTGSFDGENGGIATSTSPTMSAGTIDTTGELDLVIALFADAQVGSGTMTPGPGFATAANDLGFYALFADDLPGGAPPGFVTPKATQPAVGQANCWVAMAMALHAR